jgi:hypothetical protein
MIPSSENRFSDRIMPEGRAIWSRHGALARRESAIGVGY